MYVFHNPLIDTQMIEDILKQRLAEGSWISDVKNLMNPKDLLAHALVFLYFRDRLGKNNCRFAADTVAHVLPFTIWHAVNCRSAWHKLTTEVRALDKEDLKIATLARLPYLNGIIQEGRDYFDLADIGLRLNPPVSFGHRREMLEDGEIAGHKVPAGVTNVTKQFS